MSGRILRFSALALAGFGLTAGLVHAQDKPSPTGAALRPEVRAERFDDWTLRCVMPLKTAANATGSPACEITQPLMVNQDGKPVEILNLAVSKASDKAGKVDWALVVLTPLDVQLASDFGFAAGTAKPSLLRYRNCNHLGCFVIVPLDGDRIAQLKKAADGAAFFRLLTGQAVKVTFSLKGFTRAFDMLASGAIPAAAAPVKPDSDPAAKREGASK